MKTLSIMTIGLLYALTGGCAKVSPVTASNHTPKEFERISPQCFPLHSTPEACNVDNVMLRQGSEIYFGKVIFVSGYVDKVENVGYVYPTELDFSLKRRTLALMIDTMDPKSEEALEKCYKSYCRFLATYSKAPKAAPELLGTIGVVDYFAVPNM